MRTFLNVILLPMIGVRREHSATAAQVFLPEIISFFGGRECNNIKLIENEIVLFGFSYSD